MKAVGTDTIPTLQKMVPWKIQVSKCYVTEDHWTCQYKTADATHSQTYQITGGAQRFVAVADPVGSDDEKLGPGSWPKRFSKP